MVTGNRPVSEAANVAANFTDFQYCRHSPLKLRAHWSVTVSFCQFSDGKLLISCIFSSNIGNNKIITETSNQNKVFSYCWKYVKLEAVSHWTGRNWQWLISVYAVLCWELRKGTSAAVWILGFNQLVHIGQQRDPYLT